MTRSLSQPVIEFDNVSYRHSDDLPPVLNKLSFSIQQGDSVILAGPSGSGKSTMMLLMNGILPSNSNAVFEGNIRWFGTPSSNWSSGTISKRIGVLFQDPESQFCMTTVEEEMAFGLENLHVPKEEMKNRIQSSLAQIGLEGYETRKIQRLSGGQKQRVALACLLAMKTEVLILDEPFANVDPLSRKELIECLYELKKTLGLTIVVIDHDLHGWLDWIDRAILLNSKGTIKLDNLLTEALNDRYDVFEELTIALPLFIQLQKGKKKIIVNEEKWRLQLSEMERQSIIISTEKNATADTSNAKSILQAKNLSYSIKDQPIIQEVNFTVCAGETIAFCGHNGAGKSTLSFLIAGLFSGYQGEIKVNNRNINSYSIQDLRSEIGYVFQNPEHQFVEHTVAEDAAFGLKMKKYPNEHIQQRVQTILSSIGLTGYENQHPLSLSQGQKRRLSVASMTIDDLDILLLDEPTYGQDASSMKNLIVMLKARKEEGKTTIIITHDMKLVDQLADRTLLLSNGRIAFEGPTEDLWKLGELSLMKHSLLLPPSVKLVQEIGENQYVASYH